MRLLLPLVTLALILLARPTLTRFIVSNRSMLPTLHPGDRVLVNCLAYRWRNPRPGDVVLLRHPQRPALTIVKRIAGLPNDRLTPNHYFVLGDNHPESRDSRHFGPVPASCLLGRVWYRYWPPHRRGPIRSTPDFIDI